MSSLKRLNREFESVSSNMFTAEDEAHLHCILGVNSGKISFTKCKLMK